MTQKVKTVELNPTEDPFTLAVRATCAGQGHPAATWSVTLGRAFCHCGSHRYTKRLSATAAIQERNRWEPIRVALATATQPSVPTYAQFHALDCDQRYVMVRAMGANTRPAFLAHLGWDEVEFLAESAFLSRDTVYRDQVIARLDELATGPEYQWPQTAVASYRHAAAMQDAKLGYWADR